MANTALTLTFFSSPGINASVSWDILPFIIIIFKESLEREYCGGVGGGGVLLVSVLKWGSRGAGGVEGVK